MCLMLFKKYTKRENTFKGKIKEIIHFINKNRSHEQKKTKTIKNIFHNIQLINIKSCTTDSINQLIGVTILDSYLC